MKRVEALEALESFLTDDEALTPRIIRSTACNHRLVTAYASPRAASVAAVVVVGPVSTTSVAPGCLASSEGRIQLLEVPPVVQLFHLRGR